MLVKSTRIVSFQQLTSVGLGFWTALCQTREQRIVLCVGPIVPMPLLLSTCSLFSKSLVPLLIYCPLHYPLLIPHVRPSLSHDEWWDHHHMWGFAPRICGHGSLCNGSHQHYRRRILLFLGKVTSPTTGGVTLPICKKRRSGSVGLP